MYVTAPSGFGKTALLANWAISLRGSDYGVCYTFINRLEGVSDEDFGLRNLCQQLAAFHSLSGELPDHKSELRGLYSNLLTTPPPAGRKLIVIIDGLDEAVGWVPGPDLFPSTLPNGIHVVFSAREIAGWDLLAVLRLELHSVETLTLREFGVAQIADLLSSAGGIAASWAAKSDSIMAVLEASGGDPLYLHFLVEDIRNTVVTTVEKLRHYPRGLNEYLDEWWRNELGQATSQTDVRDLLGYLLVAKGPLGREDLISISDADNLDSWVIEHAIEQVKRYVVGNESHGYALAHQRFQEYLSRRIKHSDQEPYRERLLQYCAEWREHRSPYAFAHYSEHLFEIGQAEPFYGLLGKDWLDWKFSQTGSHSAFANDLHLALQLNATETDPPNVAQEARLRLIMAVLGSLSMNTSPDLLGAIAQLGDSGKALEHADLIKDKYVRTRALCMIAMGLAHSGQTLKASELYDRVLSEQTMEFRSSWFHQSQIVISMVLSGERTRALEVAHSTIARHKSDPLSATTLAWYGVHLAQAGLADAAIDAVNASVRNPEDADFTRVISTLLQFGFTSEAVEVLERLSYLEQEPFCAIPILAGAVQALARLDLADPRIPEFVGRCARLSKAALGLHRGSDSSVYRGALLAQTALAASRAGNMRRADLFAAEAYSWAQTASSRNRASEALAATARALAQAGYLDEADSLADNILALPDDEESKPKARRDSLFEIGRARARIGDGDRVLHLVREAAELVKQTSGIAIDSYPELAVFTTHGPTNTFVTFVCDVGKFLVERAECDYALEAADCVIDPEERDNVLLAIGQALILAGEIDRAEAICSRLTQTGSVTTLLAKIAVCQAQRHQLIGAQELIRAATLRAQSLLRTYEWDSLHETLARALARCGRVALALEASKRVDRPIFRARAIAEVAASVGHDGDRARAFELVDQAISLAENADEAVSPLAQLSRIFAGAGLPEFENAVNRRCSASSVPSVEYSDRPELETFAALADALVQAGRRDLAEPLRSLNLNESGRSRGRLRQGVAAALVREATTELRMFGAGRIVELLSPLVPLVAASVGKSDAEVLADQLISLSMEIQDTYARGIALSGLARNLARIGSGDLVTRTANCMLTGPRPYAAARVLSGCVLILARHGDGGQVVPLSQAALRLVSQFPLPEFLLSLESVSGALGTAGYCNDVEAIFRYACEVEGWWRWS